MNRKNVLAVGAHLKNTVALQVDQNVFVSQHVGDLETKPAYHAFLRAAADLPRLYGARIDAIACDLRPDYLSTKWATDAGLPNEPVQHHWAHVCAGMAENEIEAPALGVAWDGTGYGLDGTIWGGEFLLAKIDGGFERVAHLKTFPLPGGDIAAREPRRAALGLLYEILGDTCWEFVDFCANEKTLLRQVLHKQVNAPRTSSVGRLFDAVASTARVRVSGTLRKIPVELVADAQSGDELVICDGVAIGKKRDVSGDSR